jgi:hypothetical protein
VEAVEARLMKAQELMGEDADDVFQDPRRGLRDVLELGVSLVEEDALGCKLDKVFELMDAHPDEKFVIFALPVDTVYTLKTRLEEHLGPKSVSLIVGNQQPSERQAEIDQFRDGSRRLLVSSRSGGEGINLQIARRLIHFDVPWNPMEMEQRVGRIHRYGSTDTVVVDTLVLKDSREQRVLARSRARLGKIASDLDQDRVEVLFSRTMSLIPLEELAALMAGENFGPLTPDDEQRIDQLITEGYHNWTERDRDFRAKTEQLRGVDRGAVSESAYRDFLVSALAAKPLPGWKSREFRSGPTGGEPVLLERDADVLQLEDGTIGYIGRNAGIGLYNATAPGVRPGPIGLNHRSIAASMRELVGEAGNKAIPPRGAGLLRVPKSAWLALLDGAGVPKIAAQGGLLLSYQRRLLDVGTSMQELSTDIHSWLVSADASESVKLSADQIGQLISIIRQAGSKITAPDLFKADSLREFEQARLRELGRDSPAKPFIGVFPLLALWMEPVNIKPGETL